MSKPHLFNSVKTFYGDQAVSVANGQNCLFLCKPWQGDDAMWFEASTAFDALAQAEKEFRTPCKVMSSILASEYNAYFAN